MENVAPKKRLSHLEKRQIKMERMREFERKRSSHDWIMDICYGGMPHGSTMQKTYRCCKKCGYNYLQFQMRPAECNKAEKPPEIPEPKHIEEEKPAEILDYNI
jgi:hypothetical protein